jgi:hypothetical protein
MRVISWNMNRRGGSEARHRRAWHYLRHDLKADLALVQEAVPPDDAEGYRPIGAAPYNWGSAVVSLRPGLTLRGYDWVPLASSLFRALGARELPDSHPGACAVADVSVDGIFLFTAISLYAQLEVVPGSKSSYYGGPRLHRMLSDLTGILARAKRRPALLAGDFNVTSQGARRSENEASAVFARLKAWGLESCSFAPDQPLGCDCPDGHNCRHVKTFRTGAQWDYAFASPSVLTRIHSSTDTRPAVWRLSDHCPMVLDIAEPRPARSKQRTT